MNWDFIIKYLPMYERAALLTVKLGLAGVICAIIVGLICAIIQYEKVPVARQIVAVYIELSRNTPLLVQLFYILWTSKDWNPDRSADMWNRRTDISWRKLYGRSVSKRTGDSRSNSDRKRIEPWHEPTAGYAVRGTATGIFNKCTGLYGKCNLSFERNECL